MTRWVGPVHAGGRRRAAAPGFRRGRSGAGRPVRPDRHPQRPRHPLPPVGRRRERAGPHRRDQWRGRPGRDEAHGLGAGGAGRGLSGDGPAGDDDHQHPRPSGSHRQQRRVPGRGRDHRPREHARQHGAHGAVRRRGRGVADDDLRRPLSRCSEDLDRIELYYFGPAHTDGDIVVVFPEKRRPRIWGTCSRTRRPRSSTRPAAGAASRSRTRWRKRWRPSTGSTG